MTSLIRHIPHTSKWVYVKLSTKFSGCIVLTKYVHKLHMNLCLLLITFFFTPSPLLHDILSRYDNEQTKEWHEDGLSCDESCPTRNQHDKATRQTAIHILHNAGKQTIFKSCTHKPARNELSVWICHYLVNIWSRTRMNNSFHGGSTTAWGFYHSNRTEGQYVYGQTLSSSVSFCDDYNFKVFLL